MLQCQKLVSLSLKVEKGGFRGWQKEMKPGIAVSCSTSHKRQGEKRKKAKPGQLFNQRQTTGWKVKKWLAVSLFLNELQDEECKFRDQVGGSNILPRQVFHEKLTASGRTDVSNTLAQTCLTELWCGMHRSCSKSRIQFFLIRGGKEIGLTSHEDPV